MLETDKNQTIPPEEPPKIEYKPYISDDLVRIQQLFAQHFLPDPQVVYYPCCDLDASPASAFPNSRVCFVDISTIAVDSLKKAGYEAHLDSAQIFSFPEKVDVLILQNPSIGFDRPARNVKVGGYILCNNYHGTADGLAKCDEFKLVGYIPYDDGKKDKRIVFDENAIRAAIASDPRRDLSFFIFQRIHEPKLTDEQILEQDREAAYQEDETREAELAERKNHPSVTINIEDI